MILIAFSLKSKQLLFLNTYTSHAFTLFFYNILSILYYLKNKSLRENSLVLCFERFNNLLAKKRFYRNGKKPQRS